MPKSLSILITIILVVPFASLATPFPMVSHGSLEPLPFQASLHQPSSKWNETYGWTSYDHGYSLVECSGGGFAIAGYTASYGAGSSDAYLIRTDQNGVMLWNQTYGSTGTEYAWSVVECTGGGFAIAGSTSGFGATNLGVWLIRTDASGNHLWNQTFSGSAADHGRAVVECSDGGFAVVGYTYSFITGFSANDLWLIRTDSSGNHQWNHTFGGTGYDEGYALVETSGGFVITGNTNSFGSGMADLWVLGVDQNGLLLWNYTSGGSNVEYGRSVIECSSGGFAVAGTTGSFNTGHDIWFVRLDTNGNHLWTQRYGTTTDDEYGRAVVEVSSGGFALAGYTDGMGAGGNDAWLVRTDISGNALWHQTFGGPDDDYGYAMVEYSGGGFAIAGSSDIYTAGTNPPDVWLLWTPDTAPTTTIPTTTATSPPIPGFPDLAIALGMVGALGLGLVRRRQRRRKQ